VFLRELVPNSVLDRLQPRFVYRSDGMATAHHSPFLDDAAFDRLYWETAPRWEKGPKDLRWRVWVLTRCAMQCQDLGANFAEFGVYRGASAFMVLSFARLGPQQRFFLFDTFAGIPTGSLTASEHKAGFGGRLADTSEEEVRAYLAAWPDQVSLVVGDVTETLDEVDTGPLAFAHLDLNAAEATVNALASAYTRMVPGGMVVLDDYGWADYADQRRAVEGFLADKPETLLALPTGQALVVKL